MVPTPSCMLRCFATGLPPWNEVVLSRDYAVDDEGCLEDPPPLPVAAVITVVRRAFIADSALIEFELRDNGNGAANDS
jgi:hypothetical protein